MAFTRFNDDICRIKKKLQESTDQGRYMLNVPGNGDKPLYINDPYIRLQQWGGNLIENSFEIENDLRGMTRNINKDHIVKNNYKTYQPKINNIIYPTAGNITDQTRSTHPSWLYRDLEQTNWKILHFNPQNNVYLPFQNNLNTRIIEKDLFIQTNNK